MRPLLLEIEGLQSYKEKQVINFEKLCENGLFGIFGETGSGKSTLIQHFNALIRPTSGTITYNGEDIWGEKYDRRTLRSEVGLVFQYPEHQLFEIDVLTDVCFGRIF